MSEFPKHDPEYFIGSFNPSDDPAVTEIKEAAKNFITIIQAHCPPGRRVSAACTCIENAGMMAVKSLFAGA